MSAWPQRRPQVQWVLFLLPVLLLLAWVGGDLLAVKGDETLRATIILTVLSLASLLIFWMATRAEPQGRILFNVLLVSFGLKLFAAWFRFYAHLLADAFVYSETGAEIAEQLSRGQWPALPDYTGTEFVRLFTGLVYFVTGPTTYGATILWAWIGLLGMLFFYKAFTTAFPNGHRRLFMLMMRPHIAGVFVVALAAFALTRPIRAGMLTPVIRLFGLLLFVAIAVGVVRTAAGFVRLESLAAQDVLEFIEVRRERTMQGGSAFEQVNPTTPSGLALAIPTVLFRPFPWEANNVFALVAALEGLGLFMLIVYRWRSVVAALAGSLRDGYLLMMLVYSLLFIFFFSEIANFGIIARQRVQLFPFIFIMISYLSSPPRRQRSVG